MSKSERFEDVRLLALKMEQGVTLPRNASGF